MSNVERSASSGATPPTRLSTANPAPAVALLSGSALAFEILLVRLFAIADWHHLAFLVISLALLGYGASGTLIAVARARLLRHFESTTAAAAAAFAAASVGAVLLSQRVALNSLEIFWSTRQLGLLFLLYLLFAVPFFCAATAIGLALSRFGAESPRIYRADLLGAGIGAAAVTVLLYLVHPVTALRCVSAAGFAAAALFARRRWALPGAVAAAAILALPPLAFPLRSSEFKELSQALRMPEARVIEERSSPLALLTAVESPAVPFRHAPGLSLAFTGEVGRQIGVYADGSGMTPVNRWTGDRDTVSWLDYVPGAVLWHLGAPPRRVAVLGAGGGSDVLSALVHGATEVTAVELNPQMIDLVRSRFAGESGRIYSDPRVRVVKGDARLVIRESASRYDAIQMAMLGSAGASAAGVQALSENSLYTVEAMDEMTRRLRPGGVLAVTRWMQSPPREVLKLFATAVAAHERRGTEAASRVALFRGWNTATLLVKNGAWSAGEIAALRRFCEERSFDLDVAPGVRRDETNRYNQLDGPVIFDAAAAILAGGDTAEDFFERYKFDIRPATDERPYFFHSFRWSALPELLRLRARGGIPLLEWGYLVLAIGLLQALLASVVLILVPLLLFRRRGAGGEPAWRLVVYFGAIGFAFLFVEIAFIQRLTFFLGNPVFSVAVVLASFLLFGGLGSGFAARVPPWRAAVVPAAVALAAIVALIFVRSLTGPVWAIPAPARLVLSVALVAPLAFLMGMPFPLGLRRLAHGDAAAIPWAWGINGTASVLGSASATLVAVHFGFTVLVLFAAALYAVAGASVSAAVRR